MQNSGNKEAVYLSVQNHGHIVQSWSGYCNVYHGRKFTQGSQMLD